jgi:flavin-binding protein dodecin
MRWLVRDLLHNRIIPPRAQEARSMSDHVYKTIEITGSSPDGIEAAVGNAIAKAGKSLHNLRWLQVLETRGEIADGKVAHWQVTMKVGFTLD